MDLQTRLGRADALHSRETTFPNAAQVCRCQQWKVEVPYNATAASIAHEQHRTDELTAAVAAWLRVEARILALAAAGATDFDTKTWVRGQLHIVRQLADSISPEATP